MTRPRMLDLFCCEGGASAGYVAAGFDVVGVDIEPQPRYPYEFHQGDALEYVTEHGHEFDAIHASPPCQSYSRAFRHLARDEPKLIEDVREGLRTTCRPWVIENVEGAPLTLGTDLTGDHCIMLCGTMFGRRIYRHRLFQSNAFLSAPGLCNHTLPAMNPHQAAGRRLIEAEFGRAPERRWRAEMGVPWMTKAGAREAIPPAYTRHIGAQLMAHLTSERVA